TVSLALDCRLEPLRVAFLEPGVDTMDSWEFSANRLEPVALCAGRPVLFLGCPALRAAQALDYAVRSRCRSACRWCGCERLISFGCPSGRNSVGAALRGRGGYFLAGEPPSGDTRRPSAGDLVSHLGRLAAHRLLSLL